VNFQVRRAATFEESKREFERREAEKHAQNQSADDKQADSADTTTNVSVAEPSFPSESDASSEVSADSSVNSTANSATESATDSDVATSATGLPNAESATPSSQDDTNSQA
jgi:cell division protease FtsH